MVGRRGALPLAPTRLTSSVRGIARLSALVERARAPGADPTSIRGPSCARSRTWPGPGSERSSGALRRARAKAHGTRMVGVAPPARPAPPAEIRELGAAGRAVARRCEDRAEGHRRGRGRRLGGVSGHASPHWRKPPKRRETGPRAHDWEARTSASAGPACGDPRSALRAFTRRAPLAEFLDRHSTRVLAGSNGAPPSRSAVTWSSVRSRVGCAGCSGPSPGQR